MRYFRFLIIRTFLFYGFTLFGQKNISSVGYDYQKLKKVILDKNNEIQNKLIYSKIYLKKAKSENNVTEIINGYYYVGNNAKNIFLNLKFSDSAIALAKLKKPNVLPLFYFFRGDIFYTEKRLKEALDCYLLANKLVDKANIPLINKINYSIGLIKKTQGNYEEAIPIYKKCEETAYNYKQSYYPLYVLGLSELYNRVKKIDKSEEYITKGILSCKYYMNGDYYLPYFISNRGKNYFERYQFSKAIIDFKNPLNEIRENGDFSNYAENCFYLGECYNKLKQEKQAVFYYQKVDSIFRVKKDIYIVTIAAYERLINYYKKKEDYRKVMYYTDQFIEADKTLDANYKYITGKISKSYDIQKVVITKQNIIRSLQRDKIKFIILISGLILLLFILFLKNHKKKKEIVKQKELFETFKKQREKKLSIIQNLPKTNKITLDSIDNSVVQQILKCLDKFEKEQSFLENEYSVEMLAFEFKTNSTYLSRVINEIKEQNFTQYINTLRITYILEKIEKEPKFLLFSIQALSDSCGYNSVQTFTRAFVNHTKMKPSEYIKQLKNKKL